MPDFLLATNTFMKELDNLLGGSFEEFSIYILNDFKRIGYML